MGSAAATSLQTAPLADAGSSLPAHGAPMADAATLARTGAGDAASRPAAVPSNSTSAAHPDAPALPTLADVAKLTADSDYSVFMAKGVAPEVKNAAMKKLFSDPHYNIMDGLDIYIDDYSSPEIMPKSMLRKMASARVLNLFTDEDEARAVAEDEAAAELAAADQAAAQVPAQAAAPEAAPAENDASDGPDRLESNATAWATPASTPPPGTATDEPGSNRIPPDMPAEPTARLDNRLHVATAAPRAPVDVLASAPRPDASRADDGPPPVPSRSGDS
ncbi:hypothetical protein GCM10007242_23240 [Pigmentiphaga litoralis]|uniref:DUF3306 domain-containing protein n=1 Tax=Pigmentiphaga litoralis TaxID=516702 RepID=UPI001677917B|nr:hypothetical protein GCM10007242_23240 [Pigmentiphaga litoralis]